MSLFSFSRTVMLVTSIVLSFLLSLRSRLHPLLSVSRISLYTSILFSCLIDSLSHTSSSPTLSLLTHNSTLSHSAFTLSQTCCLLFSFLPHTYLPLSISRQSRSLPRLFQSLQYTHLFHHHCPSPLIPKGSLSSLLCCTLHF